MADRSGKFLPVGMRAARVYELDTNGRPKATSVLPYTGLGWSGPKTFELSVAQARVLTHPGADRVLRTAVLPSLETSSGTLRVSDYRYDIRSVLSGVAVGKAGEAAELAHGTSRQGHEPVVGLMIYQQSQDLVTGLATWHATIFPKCRMVVQQPGYGEGVGEVVYQVVPTPSTQRLWGITCTQAVDGYTDALDFDYDTEGIPAVATFLGDGAETEFAFTAGEEALSVDKILVTKNGVAVSSGITLDTTGITFTTPPASNDNICVWYEMVDTTSPSESV